ncbi:MAG: hypothetical protein EA363_05405, partial [Balneolaceae bacterium]
MSKCDNKPVTILTDIRNCFRIFRKHLGRRMYLVFVLTALAVSAEAFGIALLLPLLHMIETAGLPQGAGGDAISGSAAGTNASGLTDILQQLLDF